MANTSFHLQTKLPTDSSTARPALGGLACAPNRDELIQATEAELSRLFRQSFSILNVATASVELRGKEDPGIDWYRWLPALQEIANRGQPAFFEEASPMLALAIPLQVDDDTLVAVSTFVTSEIKSPASITASAKTMSVEPASLFAWSQDRLVWPPHAVLPLAEKFCELFSYQHKLGQQTLRANESSTQLMNTFEEITLLHRLIQQLSLSGGVHELCEMVAQWLDDVLPAECVALSLSVVGDELSGGQQVNEPVLVSIGDSPVDSSTLASLATALGEKSQLGTVVLGHIATNATDWPFPGIRDVVSVPIRTAETNFGWIVAINHTAGKFGQPSSESGFGTVEASLMGSVAAILGIHCGNLDLYQQQADFFSSMVRSLTSAIDAKDPYTCGHSDRVARLSVLLANQLGCTTEEIDTLYLSGLLHDIGKIGIDTNILRKEGPLTKAEYEHIKTHPELGHEILHGVKQLDKVLPIVLHHHEAWDGSGYPHGLKGEECTKLARIAAVADSIDAMSSDRSYRKGMSDDKLDAILRDGSGKQWDATVIDAVFQVREEIREIGKS